MGPTPQEASVGGDAGDFLEEDPGDFFEEFVRCRSAQLFKLALLLTGQNRAEAEDLLQIALECAYRRRALLATDRTPEPYVRKVLVNASIDRRRLIRRRGEQPLAATGPGPAVADLTGEVADRDLLVRSLAELPPRQRAVLVLRYFQDMSEAEIAWTLACSVGTVKSQASRGLARLRELAGLLPDRPLGYPEVRDRHD
jgi:RNA polymerase sigma-70 factor (sigma-E family)